MKIVNLKKQEFDDYAKKVAEANFHQTSSWGELKEENGWQMHLIGLKEEDKILGAAMILSKQTPFRKKMFYSPRGFLIDYNNFELLKDFTKGIKEYIKKHKGIFIKIDPYLEYQERDRLGNVIVNGKNNKEAFKNLIKLGYKHFGFNLMQDTLQPRWMFTTNTKGRTIEDVMQEMDSKTRQIIRKNERNLIKCREIGYDELKTFKDIMQHTGNRREFIDRPLKYYQNMYKHLSKENIIKVIVAELDTLKLLEELKQEIEREKNELKIRQEKYDDNPKKMNEDKFKNKQQETNNNIVRLEKRILDIEKLKEKHGSLITLGGILFLIYGSEVLSLVGGSYSELMEFQSAYTIHWEGIKMALQGNYKRYNFYGITGDFDEKNPLFGLYSFKRDFGGQVVELLGEFDLVADKPFYFIYKMTFSMYRGLKNIKVKLKK